MRINRFVVGLLSFSLVILNLNTGVMAKKPKFPDVRLPKSLKGQEAINALASKLPEVAAWYGMSPHELKDQLRSDNSLRVDKDAHLFYLEENLPAPTPDVNDDYFQTSIPLDKAFFLHSSPASKKKIHLDFDGHNIPANNAWSQNYNSGNAIPAPAWDLDGDRTSFNSTERSRIIAIWKQVSEDFAAFDVDVTTEEPSFSELNRSDYNDDTFGIRVLVSPISSYVGNYGGIAYVGVFDYTNNEYYQPALVFPEKLSNNVKYVSEASSHEAGHNLGLSHDGTNSGVTYYGGHANWAPIMGNSYSKSVTHWSKGEYNNANNLQDDYVVMANNSLVFRADDHGDILANASEISVIDASGSIEAYGFISSPSDVDYFSFNTNDGEVTLRALTSNQTPNLDIEMNLYDGAGGLIASYAPGSTLGAEFTMTLAAGTYFVSIDGIGTGDPTTGYSDYSSLGRYKLTGSIIDISGQLPTAVASSDLNSGFGPLLVNFTGSNSFDSDGFITSYSWDFGDGSSSIEADPSHSFINSGAYTVSLTVQDNDGFSSSTSLTVEVLNNPPTAIVSVSQSTGTAPLLTSFDASSSYDDDGSITNYSWNFGDGRSATGISVNHSYESEGSYNAVLTVTDNEGAQDTASIVIDVAPNPNFVTAPSNLNSIVNNQVVTLSWADNSSNETNFLLERSVKAKGRNKQLNFSQIASVAESITNFSETVDYGSYVYRVRAFNANTGIYSDYSSVLEVQVREPKGGGGGRGGKKK